MGSAARTSRKLLKWLGGLAGLLQPVGRLYDERLTAGVREVLEPPPVTVPAGENAHFAVLGHRTRAGKDPHAAGMEFAERLAGAPSSDPAAADKPPEELLGLPTREVVDEAGLREEGCDFSTLLEKAVERKEAAAALPAANSELLDRYRRTLEFPRFQETLPFPCGAEDLRHSGSRLYLIDVALRLLAGGTDEAVAMQDQGLSAMPAGEYLARREGTVLSAPVPRPPGGQGTKARQWWFNFAGNGRANIGHVNLTGHTEREHALDAPLALAGLQIAPAAGGEGRGMESFLAGAVPADRNPFTGDPPGWDDAEQATFFMVPGDSLAEGQRRRESGLGQSEPDSSLVLGPMERRTGGCRPAGKGAAQFARGCGARPP